jgi:hypothetical protein
MLRPSLIRRSIGRKIIAGICKTERIIWAAPDYIGIMVILSVVLPKAYRANIVATTVI